jgi:hypothetical protein
MSRTHFIVTREGDRNPTTEELKEAVQICLSKGFLPEPIGAVRLLGFYADTLSKDGFDGANLIDVFECALSLSALNLEASSVSKTAGFRSQPM